MVKQICGSMAVVALALGALILANFLRDRGAAPWVPRRLAAALGGATFLAAVLWLEAGTAIGVLGALTIGIAAVHWRRRQGLRGVNGDRPGQNWSEVTFAGLGTLSLSVGWGLMGDKWMGFLPAAFMAWGDSAAGIMREISRSHHVTRIWPLAAMAAVCLAAAVLYQPYWTGAVGAIAATTVEGYRPKIKFWDDNLNIAAAALLAMAACLWINKMMIA
jgi:hypothetical protein